MDPFVLLLRQQPCGAIRWTTDAYRDRRGTDRARRCALRDHNIEAIVVETGMRRAIRPLVIPRAPRSIRASRRPSRTSACSPSSPNPAATTPSARGCSRWIERPRGREIRKLVGTPDFMVGSVSAVTEAGALVAAAATGSQLGAYASGAGRLILVVGSQKIVPDLDAALRRIDEVVFPYEDAQVVARLGVHTILEKVLFIHGESTAGRTTVVLVRDPSASRASRARKAAGVRTASLNSWRSPGNPFRKWTAHPRGPGWTLPGGPSSSMRSRPRPAANDITRAAASPRRRAHRAPRTDSPYGARRGSEADRRPIDASRRRSGRLASRHRTRRGTHRRHGDCALGRHSARRHEAVVGRQQLPPRRVAMRSIVAVESTMSVKRTVASTRRPVPPRVPGTSGARPLDRHPGRIADGPTRRGRPGPSSTALYVDLAHRPSRRACRRN